MRSISPKKMHSVLWEQSCSSLTHIKKYCFILFLSYRYLKVLKIWTRIKFMLFYIVIMYIFPLVTHKTENKWKWKIYAGSSSAIPPICWWRVVVGVSGRSYSYFLVGGKTTNGRANRAWTSVDSAFSFIFSFCVTKGKIYITTI